MTYPKYETPAQMHARIVTETADALAVERERDTKTGEFVRKDAEYIFDARPHFNALEFERTFNDYD